MDTINSIVITLTNKEVQEALLNYAFKRQPAVRPLGTKSTQYPQILINTSHTDLPCFLNITYNDANKGILEDITRCIIIVDNPEEKCDDKK